MAAAGGRGDPLPRPARLLDLPDELLRGVAARMVGGAPCGTNDLVALLPLLLTCRRLAAVAYSSVTGLSVMELWEGQVLGLLAGRPMEVPPTGLLATGLPATRLLASPWDRQAGRPLAAVIALLGRTPHVRTLTLICSPEWPAPALPGSQVGSTFWGPLLRAVAALPIRTLMVGGHAASSALLDARVSAVPLKHFRVWGVDLSDGDQRRGVTSVLARHGRTLPVMDLHNTTDGPIGPEGWGCSGGFTAPFLRSIGTLPALKELQLTCFLCHDVATAVAAGALPWRRSR